jgi:putative endonuclease
MKSGIVYVLQSLKDNRTYIGSTDNFERRFKQHNSCQVKSTRHRIPFKILFIEEFQTLAEARKRETWWKSGAGRKKLKEYFDVNHQIQP